MPSLTRAGASLHYVRAGAGTPPIVFVHGFACAHQDWRFQLEHFAHAHQAVALDLRGHGASHAQPQSCSFRACAGDVAALLRDLDLRGAVLVGHSMGCRIVLQARLDAPDRVAGLVLLDGSTLADPRGAVEDRGAAVEARFHAELEQSGYPAFARALYGQALLPDTDAGRAIFDRAVALDPQVGIRLFSSLAAWDAGCMVEALRETRIPLLALQSTYLDEARQRVRLLAGETSPWLDLVREMVPHAHTEIVPGPGHFTMIEAPLAVNEAIERFIRSGRPGLARRDQGRGAGAAE
jgi:pimeloyl-ACP methyl ester carboxylesterase